MLSEEPSASLRVQSTLPEHGYWWLRGPSESVYRVPLSPGLTCWQITPSTRGSKVGESGAVPVLSFKQLAL